MASLVTVLNNVRILPGTWRNFSGKPGDFNAPIGQDSFGNPIGKRYFSIELTPDMAEALRNVELATEDGELLRGCNIKTYVPEGGDPQYSLKVTFGKYPPESIWRVVPKGRMALNLDNVGNLDHEFIDKADVKINLVPYKKGPNKGITAYLNKLIVYIREDDFDSDEKFAGIPIIGGETGSNGHNGPVQDNDGELPF